MTHEPTEIAIHADSETTQVVRFARINEFDADIIAKIVTYGCWSAYKNEAGTVDLIIEGGDDPIHTDVPANA